MVSCEASGSTLDRAFRAYSLSCFCVRSCGPWKWHLMTGSWDMLVWKPWTLAASWQHLSGMRYTHLLFEEQSSPLKKLTYPFSRLSPRHSMLYCPKQTSESCVGPPHLTSPTPSAYTVAPQGSQWSEYWPPYSLECCWPALLSGQTAFLICPTFTASHRSVVWTSLGPLQLSNQMRPDWPGKQWSSVSTHLGSRRFLHKFSCNRDQCRLLVFVTSKGW